jgi:tight adherence protein B
MTTSWVYILASSAAWFAALFVLVGIGGRGFLALLGRLERRYDHVLNHHLLLDVPPRLAILLSGGAVIVSGLAGLVLFGGLMAPLIFALCAMIVPPIIIRYLETKRQQRLEAQLVDGIVALASGVRAGLTLVQAMELLVNNLVGPIKQEFAQLLREYQMGLDLNQAMRNTANRVGSSNYRLLFTAVEMHRLRGGDTGESLDRIAESIREIQRLEGKLDAITAQGRAQALGMALTPILILGVFYLIDSEDVTLLFTTSFGRILLLFVTGIIVIGFLWIRKIMAVDI